MMVVWRRSGRREHRVFCDLPDILSSDNFLVMNNTRVFPARLRANRPGKKETIEILLLRELKAGEWLALLKPASKAPLGQALQVSSLRAIVSETRESGSRVLRFDPGCGLMEIFDQIGEPPLPPYIHRKKGKELAQDRDRYQTVYAKRTGSIAAPTAGLHFTPRIFEQLEARGIGRCEILLHVGYGTFQPVRCEEIEDHRFDAEYFEVEEGAARFISRNKTAGHRLVAVGSTTTRVLEHLAARDFGFDRSESGFCDLFIYPGYRFRILDGMLTNFHLPRSTLFMLVSAFAGRELMLDCYRNAISEGYRFFSYGDCMLLL